MKGACLEKNWPFNISKASCIQLHPAARARDGKGKGCTVALLTNRKQQLGY
jgi:hypothetical protein